jgi:hypothetical protein
MISILADLFTFFVHSHASLHLCFCRAVRCFAQSKGLYLNHTGLYYLETYEHRGKTVKTGGALHEHAYDESSEEHVFSLLGLPYIEPTQRAGSLPPKLLAIQAPMEATLPRHERRALGIFDDTRSESASTSTMHSTF